MNLTFITLVLDGMPYIKEHLPVFCALSVPWRWIIVHGAADNVRDTSWCSRIEPRLSNDGTTAYLDEIAKHPNVTVLERESWPGKTAMVNEALRRVHGGLVWQVDADEIWTAKQIERMHRMFENNPMVMWARFRCRYFVGKELEIVSRGTYGNHDWEWTRLWRWVPGMYAEKHEPPVMMSPTGENIYSYRNCLGHDATEAAGCVFNHYAYATERQVAFKEKYYRYKGAVDCWRKLQENTSWPVFARTFLPWVKDDAVIDLCKTN